MFKIKREIGQGDMIPKGYGVAYNHDFNRVAMVYPIPLNLIVALIVKIWRFVIVPQELISSARDKFFKQAYEKARKFGVEQGYREGLRLYNNQFQKEIREIKALVR